MRNISPKPALSAIRLCVRYTEANNYENFIEDNKDLFENTKSVLFEDLLKVHLNTNQLMQSIAFFNFTLSSTGSIL
jgi:hypothetical protein